MYVYITYHICGCDPIVPYLDTRNLNTVANAKPEKYGKRSERHCGQFLGSGKFGSLNNNKFKG